jgi:uncharacterized protein (DUF488 family)
VTLFTIGFTKKSASTFFGLLGDSGARTLIDVRLNNVSQLAGFAKRDDLRYFLSSICGMGYEHDLRLAPTADLLDGYKKRGGSWAAYETSFLDLMRARSIESTLRPDDMDDVVLLCSEAEPHRCHRRLVAEYLRDAWGGIDIAHL